MTVIYSNIGKYAYWWQCVYYCWQQPCLRYTSQLTLMKKNCGSQEMDTDRKQSHCVGSRGSKWEINIQSSLVSYEMCRVFEFFLILTTLEEWDIHIRYEVKFVLVSLQCLQCPAQAFKGWIIGASVTAFLAIVGCIIGISLSVEWVLFVKSRKSFSQCVI